MSTRQLSRPKFSVATRCTATAQKKHTRLIICVGFIRIALEHRRSMIWVPLVSAMRRHSLNVGLLSKHPIRDKKLKGQSRRPTCGPPVGCTALLLFSNITRRGPPHNGGIHIGPCLLKKAPCIRLRRWEAGLSSLRMSSVGLRGSLPGALPKPWWRSCSHHACPSVVAFPQFMEASTSLSPGSCNRAGSGPLEVVPGGVLLPRLRECPGVRRGLCSILPPATPGVALADFVVRAPCHGRGGCGVHGPSWSPSLLPQRLQGG